MHICIIGTGVSGLMTACELLNLDFIEKISIIGSSRIPPIKVGESTTESFYRFVEKNFNISDFVKSTDASIKYGVYYENWSKENFIHFFGSNKPFIRKSTIERVYCEMLANKDPKIHIHDLIGIKLWKFIQKNEVSLNLEEHIYSWHFEASKLKIFLKNHLRQNNKIKFFDDTIVECKFSFEESIEYIIGESKNKYFADYFVNCSGDHEVNEKVFKNEYASTSSYLLTNKALVYPLKYTNKKNQFHPYTVSRTMKHGWRWITPTQSRIGTGYVFSDNHVSVDEATNDFLEDIGDKTIEPFLVDFSPKYNKKPFRVNNCTIGMSSGFLEPLDAPGLAHTNAGIGNLIIFLKKSNEIKNQNTYVRQREKINLCKVINHTLYRGYEWWCSFILHQYKTCWRNDTQFWVDHKNVKCYFYEEIIKSMECASIDLFERYEYEMLFKTTAGKNIQWKSKLKSKPFPVEELDTETIHHLDYIQKFYD